MNSHLWLKLTGAFVVVLTVATLVTVVLTREGAATQFAHFMISDEMIRPIRMQETLANYYHDHQGWDALGEQMDAMIVAASDGTMSGMVGGMMGMPNNGMRVVDANGRVLFDTPATGVSAIGMSESGMDMRVEGGSMHAYPIEVHEELVGELIVVGSMMSGGDGESERLLGGVTRAVVVAGVIAGVLAMGLAGLLVRQITSPLVSLTHASQRIEHGDLAARVPVQSQDELGVLAATFNRMAEKLQTQEALRRNLVADVAHELRTPLAAIQGTVEALQDGVFPLTAQGLQPIHEEVLLLNRLVEDLRLLSNAEAGQLSLHIGEMSVEDLCRRHADALCAMAIERGIDLQVEIVGVLPIIQGDEQRLGQVLSNLIENALRHTPVAGTVRVVASEFSGGVSVIVVDTGMGISAEALSHVFDRFYRTDRSRSRESGGSGLGLAIARQIVEAHQGHAWVNSPPMGQENGTEVGLWLPSVREPAK